MYSLADPATKVLLLHFARNTAWSSAGLVVECSTFSLRPLISTISDVCCPVSPTFCGVFWYVCPVYPITNPLCLITHASPAWPFWPRYAVWLPGVFLKYDSEWCPPPSPLALQCPPSIHFHS